MAKCNKCGAMISNDQLICPECHEKVEKITAEDIGEKIKDMGKTEDYSGAFSPKDASDNKIMALLCYIPLICLWPVIFESKKSAYLRFHANAGLVLFITEILSSLLLGIIGAFLAFVPLVGLILVFVVNLVSYLLGLAFFAGIVYGIFQTLTGKATDLPIIGKIRILK